MCSDLATLTVDHMHTPESMHIELATVGPIIATNTRDYRDHMMQA